jgi:hypothetical protein
MYLRSQVNVCLLIVFTSIPATRLLAQQALGDSLVFAKSLTNALEHYYESAGDQSRLYNGTEYTGYPFSFVEGSPYFLTSQEQIGFIVYDNVEYTDVNLTYDEMMGVVILKDENHRIQLSNERISRFAIGAYPFVRLVNGGNANVAPETGFYEILYVGRLSVFKKEIKTIRQIYSYSQETTRVIDTRTIYYFRKNNQYTRIESQKELLNFFSDRKKEIQHFIKSNKLSFKKDTDNLLIKVAVYYDQQIK